MAGNPFEESGTTSGNPFGNSNWLPVYKPPKPKKKKKPKINKAKVIALLESNLPKDQKAIALAQWGFTPRQTALALATVEDKGHRSFGDKLAGVGKGALGGATWTLDKLMRPSWAVTASVDEWLDDGVGVRSLGDLKDIGEAAKRGFTGKERKGFGQILDEHGVLKGHSVLRGVAGFGLDVTTDPLMLLSLGASVPTGGAATAAYMAAKAGSKAVTPRTLRIAAQAAGQKALKGDTSEIVEELLKAGGPKFAGRKALLDLNKANAAKPIMGMTTEEARSARAIEALTVGIAKKEAVTHDKRLLYLTYGTKNHSIRIPLSPALARPGQKVARAGIPVISQLTDALGKGFIPDWKDPIVRTGQVMRHHVAVHNADMQRQTLGKIFQGVDETMDEDTFLQALHYMEQPLKTAKGHRWNAVIKTKDGGYKLNERYINLLKSRGLLDHSQEDALRRYFTATEAIFKFDEAAGVAVKHFGDTGRMYVPHIVKKNGESAVPTISQRNLLTEAGFQKGRKGSLTVMQLKQLVADGKLPNDIETNPFRLLAHRSRAGAERQADMALINTLKAYVGVPTRIVSEKAVAGAAKRQEAALAKFEAATRAAAHAEDDYDKAIQKVKDELQRVQSVAEKGFRESNAKIRRGVKGKAIKELEGKIARARKPERIEALKAELRKLKAARIVTPGIVKNQAKMVKLRADLDKALKDIDNPRTKTHKQQVAEPMLAHKTAQETLRDAKKELRAANSAVKASQRGKANRAVKPDMMVDSRATDKYGNTIAFPKENADSFLRLERIVSGEDGAIEQFVEGFGKWQGAWKVAVTIVNPGYRIRNTMTDMWNWWIAPGRVTPVDLGRYGTKAARLMNQASKGDPAAVGWIQEAADHGILSGLFAGDIARVEKYFKYGGKSYRALRKDKAFVSLGVKLAQDVNKSAENWGRLSHYMWRRQKLGESAAEAAQNVRLAHFDYEDLTKFEQKLRDTIFPFYTWTRKNIPYQIKQIFAEPGRYSAFPKLAQEATYASGNPDDPVPEFVESGMGFPIGKNRYFMPQFGVSDLVPFQGPGEAKQRGLSLLSPFVKTPIEMAMNKSMFTGLPIADERHPRAPVTPLGASLLSLIPGSNVGPTSRQGADGKIHGPGANPYMAYLLGQTPISRVAGVTGPGSISAQRGKNSALTSWVTGLSTVNTDPDQQAYYASLEIQENVDKMLQGLRDMGSMPTKPRRKGVVDEIIEQILRG